ncbi:hypothetical protein HDU76_010652, partial [Blyttiomyces sp. JEL0837]
SLEGVGTRFVVSVPIVVCDGEAGVGEIVKEVKEVRKVVDVGNVEDSGNGVKRFLVVDDESINRTILVKILKRLIPTCIIDTACNGSKALNHLGITPPLSKTTAKLDFDSVTTLFDQDPTLTPSTSSTCIQQPNINNYDIIFIDIVMPILDGLSTTRILRDHGFKIPIVATTANASGMQFRGDICEEVYVKAGFDGVLGKPFTKGQIACVLEEFGVIA